MKSRYSFYEIILNDTTLGQHPGFTNYEDLKNFLISDGDIYYTIPLMHQYRPDLISYLHYGTTSLQWVITFVNGIEDSPEGYTINRIIRIPSYNKLIQVL